MAFVNLSTSIGRNNCDKESRLVTLDLFPRTPDLKNINSIQEIVNHDSEIFVEDVTTELVLFTDPFKIKKILTRSDIQQSRLLMSRGSVTKHLVGRLSEHIMRQVETNDGAIIIVRDLEDNSLHQLVFALWKSSGVYVLKGWNKEFVKRKRLAVGDEVGLHWDHTEEVFHFCVLRKA